MHRHEWSNVSAIEPRPSLPEPSESIHKLYLRRWQSGADMAAGRTFGPEFSPIYQRSYRICSNFPRRCPKNSPAEVTDYTRKDLVQTEYLRKRICAINYSVQNEQSGNASTQR